MIKQKELNNVYFYSVEIICNDHLRKIFSNGLISTKNPILTGEGFADLRQTLSKKINTDIDKMHFIAFNKLETIQDTDDN